jgi:hypothetical protein
MGRARPGLSREAPRRAGHVGARRAGWGGLLCAALWSCQPPHAAPGEGQGGLPPAPPQEALARDWLDGTGELTRARFDRVLGLAMADPEATRLVGAAVSAFHLEGPRGLLALLSVCSAELPEDGGGRTTSEYNIHVFSLDMATLVTGARSPAFEAHLREVTTAPGVVRWTLEPGPDYVLVRRWLLPRVCLARGLDLATAYDTFVHELTHALLRDPHSRPRRPSDYEGAGEYLLDRVQMRGDEIDAYLAGSQARLRLGRGKVGLLAPIARSIGPAGEPLVSREQLAHAVLDPPPAGLDYARTALRDAYPQALAAERAELRARLQVVGQALAQRAAAVEVAEHNVAAHQHNAGLRRAQAAAARARGDAAGEQRFLEEAAGDERLLAASRAEAAAAAASRARLAAEEPALRAAAERVERRLE